MLRTTPGPVVLAAGDIADKHNASKQTAALLRREKEATVLALGDNAYKCGATEDYESFYTPTWGRASIFDRTWACPGNHEFDECGTAGAGYRAFFRSSHAEAWERSGSKDFYSFEIAGCAWHFVSLNSEVENGRESRQFQWLREDLSSHPGKPILAFYHRPRFSSGNHGSQKDLDDLWRLLCEFKTEIVLNGHDHSYERFHRLNADGERDPQGTVQFVVGTGGRELDGGGAPKKNSAIKPKKRFGILRLVLNPTTFDFEFVSVDGEPVDSGEGHAINPH